VENNHLGKQLSLEILSPEGEILRDTIDQITCVTSSGEITILPNHEPLFTKLSEGEMAIKKGSEVSSVTVAGGFLEVVNNKLSILADYAIRSEKIEEEKANDARKRAEELLKEKHSSREQLQAEKYLRQSILQLKVLDKYRKRRPKASK
jgi:F-type H+-transporting ATPase subunit epsilon